ncbi:hypothetical protein ACFSFY_02550 [Sporosarcina siberiensis]|uniref:Uncharacterized protein n=1 Tax=Sporosarcina siberiensis TaxID=1365606 RepID=A0ABW4SC68_9BACL
MMSVSMVKNEVVEEDFTVEVVTYILDTGIKLKIYDGKEATLTINGYQLSFTWNHATEHLFHSIETVTAIELLRIIAGATL